MKLNSEELTKAYKEGKSLNTIAKEFHTYATSVKRVLEREGVELRHDVKKAGEFYVQNGEKLIEWAKAQGRLVTKTELANVLGKCRLSPSYFEKYPELGQYIATREQNDLQEYSQKLYNWLQENNIPYKPNDRTKLKMSVTALLLGNYSNIIILLNIKPKHISKKRFEQDMEEKYHRAIETGLAVVWVKKENFEKLDYLKDMLEILK